MPKWWTFWAVVLAGLALAWLTSAPPAPLPASAPATDFSAARAMETVRDIGRAPHPIGTAEHARVREAIVARLDRLGLQTRTVQATAVRKTDDGFVGADVENIVGVLPGRDRTKPAVLLMAHYDSVPGSPAAADDSAGVASILETIRAVKARGTPAADLVVLITDGEETGLFGARAAFRDGSNAGYDLRRVGAVINLETRGSTGLAFMFETGRRSAGVIDRYARHAPRPAANSLTGWVYDRMPNGSDFTVAKEADLPGVNIAFIGRPFDYHSPTATAANLSQASLQHMGDQALAMTRAFLDEGPGSRAGDRVYADLFGLWLVAYPTWTGWLVLAVAAGLIAFAVTRPGRPPILDLVRGAGLLMLLLAWPALLLRLAWRLAPTGPDFYQSATSARFDFYFAGMALLAAGAALGVIGFTVRGRARWVLAGAAVIAGLVCSARGGFDIEGAVLGMVAALLFAGVVGRPLEGRAVTGGLMLGALVLGAVAQALAPGIAFLIAWPLLAAGLAAAILAARPDGLARAIAATAVAVVGLAWLLRLASPLFDGLGLTNPELLGAFAMLAGMIVAPFLMGWIAWGKGGHWTTAGCVIGGTALIAFVALSPPWSPRSPQPSHVLYVADTKTGRARVVSPGGALDPWSRGVLASYGAIRDGALPVLFAETAWWAEAGAVSSSIATPYGAMWSYPVPTCVAGRCPSWDESAGDPRFHYYPARNLGHAPGIVFHVPDGTRDLKVTLTFSRPVHMVHDAWSFEPDQGGFPDRVRSGQPYRVRWYGAEYPVVLSFRPDAPGPGTVLVQWAALRDGWPADAKPLPARPADAMRMSSSDSTVVTGEQTLSW